MPRSQDFLPPKPGAKSRIVAFGKPQGQYEETMFHDWSLAGLGVGSELEGMASACRVNGRAPGEKQSPGSVFASLRRREHGGSAFLERDGTGIFFMHWAGFLGLLRDLFAPTVGDHRPYDSGNS